MLHSQKKLETIKYGKDIFNDKKQKFWLFLYKNWYFS